MRLWYFIGKFYFQQYLLLNSSTEWAAHATCLGINKEKKNEDQNPSHPCQHPLPLKSHPEKNLCLSGSLSPLTQNPNTE